MIKAVIFDIDGVLLDSFEANFKFIGDIIHKFGYPKPSKESYRELFHHTTKHVIKILTNRNEEGVNEISEFAKRREIPYPHDLLVERENLIETLEILSKSYILGVVTSRQKVNLFENPILKKFMNYFKIVVGFEDTEKHKPDPEPLLLAVQKLDLKPEECVYVGDVEHHDIKAAKAALMKSILFSGEEMQSEADAKTSSFKELPDLIKNL